VAVDLPGEHDVRRAPLKLAAGLTAAVTLASCSTKVASPAAATVTPRTLRLGVLYTTTGPSGDLAQAVLGSLGLVKTEAEKQHVDVELVQEDYSGDPNRVPALVADARSKTDALLVGTQDSAVVPAVRDGYPDKPVLYPLIADDDLLSGAANAFRFGPSNAMEANVLVDFLVKHRGYRSIAILSDNSPFGLEGRSDLRTALSSAGLDPALDMTFVPGGDIHTPVAHAGQVDVDAMIIWAESESEAARIVVEEQRMGFGYQLALSGNLADATFGKNATSQVTPVAFRDGILSVGPWAGPWFRLKRIITFYDDFRNQNSALAPVQAAQVYDAALAAVDAAAKKDTTPSGLISGIESLSSFDGAGVPLTFSSTRHEGMDPDDLAILGFTKSQDSAGGDYFPEVDTGGGFFTIVNESLHLPSDLSFLANGMTATPEGSATP
jgi:ABC-type branched-subunit amino acid transport system substrate-binding protein